MLLDNNGVNDSELNQMIAKHRGEKEAGYIHKIKRHYKYIDNKYLLIELANVEEKNKKAYRGFNNALIFWVLNEKHPFKMQIINSFEQGKKYSSQEIQEKMAPILKYHFFKVSITKSRITNIFNSIFETTRGSKYSIKGLNPLKMPKPLSYIPADTDKLSEYFII